MQSDNDSKKLPINKSISPPRITVVPEDNYLRIAESQEQLIPGTRPSSYVSKISMRRQQTMQQMMENSTVNAKEELFAEKFVKVTFRDFSNNTRMDIKNVDLKAQQVKRDRAI